eukprot:4694507-Pyramimonas_sp.AAC.1
MGCGCLPRPIASGPVGPAVNNRILGPTGSTEGQSSIASAELGSPMFGKVQFYVLVDDAVAAGRSQYARVQCAHQWIHVVQGRPCPGC